MDGLSPGRARGTRPRRRPGPHLDSFSYVDRVFSYADPVARPGLDSVADLDVGRRHRAGR
ncbi:MAG TPA: hypothetical protein VFQ68_38010 [Streptosporangiaceae bacterium]|nr:hypothetical protein [Streptosporangiaceae bacterium]